MSIPVTESTNGVPCSCRPSEETFLRCSRCSKPICGPCMVRTPVGMRCPECAGVAMTFGPLSAAGAIRALIFGLIVAIPSMIFYRHFRATVDSLVVDVHLLRRSIFN